MKNILLRQLIMLSKFTFYGLFTQCLLFGVLIASDLEAQKIKPMSEVTLKLRVTDGTLREIFSEIELSSGFTFSFFSTDINLDKQVSLKKANRNLKDILLEISWKTNLAFYQVNDVINVRIKTIENGYGKADVKEAAVADPINVTGRVTSSENNESLPGVNVIIKGTMEGTATDVDGRYSIMVPSSESILVFSSIGFVKEEVVVGNRTIIDVKLLLDVKSLSEVVVIGYGTMKKSDITGAVVSVSNKELTSRPVSNVMEAMQGRAAGVDITTSMRPGTLGEINIRGARSITASNAPLYVVDGVPLASEPLTDNERMNDIKKSSGIETLNPQDIESIDILKDASAAAIYGSRGANGVVLITTKRGAEGKLSLNYAGSITMESMNWRTEYMNTREYIDFVRWAAYNKSSSDLSPGDQPSLDNDAKIELFTADPVAWANIQKGWAGGTWDASKLESFDWMDEVTQPNITQEHTLSASGGTRTMKAYASIGYLDNQGTTKGQEYQRYSLNASIDITPKDWFKFGANVNTSYMYQDYGQANIGASMSSPNNLIDAAAKIYPYALPYDSERNLVSFPGGQSRVATVIDEWKYSTNQRETIRILGSVYAEAKIIDGLRYRVNLGPDFRSYRNGIYNDGQSVVRGGSSYASYGGNKNFSWTIDNLLYYDKTWGKHTIGTTLLQTASKWKYEYYNMAAQGIAIESQQWYAMGTVSALDSWSSGLTERQLSSYMGRLNYNFDDRYLLTVSGRWDGASQLADGNKWTLFPSAALGWRIDQEEFMQNTGWISELKLRLGYGATGNSAVVAYSTKGEIDQIQQPFGSSIVSGYTTSNSLSNLELGWETTTQYNLGIDFSLYHNRVSGVIDFYKSSTSDLLMTMALPTVLGYTSSVANVGKTKNKGIDITLNTVNVQTRNFNWNSTINAAWQKEEIVSLMNGKEDMIADGWFIGNSISVYYGYERMGLWQDTPEDLAEMAKFNANGHNFTPGSVRIKDQNKEPDYKITPNDDRVVVGNRRPRWTVGLSNNFSYSNWDFSIFITGRLKYLRSVGEGLTAMYGDQRVLDYWTPNNTGAEYQKPIRDEAGGDVYSGAFYKDDSYLKVRNISLGYTFSKNLISRIGINDLRLYVQVKDVGMLWSNNKYLDSEYGTLYYNRGTVFGINVGF